MDFSGSDRLGRCLCSGGHVGDGDGDVDPVEVEVTLPLARQVSDALQGVLLRPRQLGIIARENEAPAMLVTLLSGLPPRPFASLREVQLSALGPAPIQG